MSTPERRTRRESEDQNVSTDQVLVSSLSTMDLTDSYASFEGAPFQSQLDTFSQQGYYEPASSPPDAFTSPQGGHEQGTLTGPSSQYYNQPYFAHPYGFPYLPQRDVGYHPISYAYQQEMNNPRQQMPFLGDQQYYVPGREDERILANYQNPMFGEVGGTGSKARMGHRGPPDRASRDIGPASAYYASPRGPPRKPKQSGHALWVGGLPTDANIIDLKDHFSRGATTDIESLFLISKSNCAFVNYRTEAACAAALRRFHDSRFHGVHLVCRLRRTAQEFAVVDIPSPEAEREQERSQNLESQPNDALGTTPSSAENTILESDPTATRLSASEPQLSVSSDRYFIIKSLTTQDLEASVRNRTWATQSHNEEVLNKAFEEAENVFLIFSANKSGEYFGYARMMSVISGDPVPLSVSRDSQNMQADGGPQTIPTPATATAPRGNIIDDSIRGTIFWEAEPIYSAVDGEPEASANNTNDDEQFGRQFQIEWRSTARLPFYRTRGLRNPLNANREVKIARDGTELESTLGARLIAMFHGPVSTTLGKAAVPRSTVTGQRS